MKGITPVIAVILLLLITVSLVGFAFVWFTRISTTAGTAIENKTGELLRSKSIRVENARATAVDLRNTGSVTINENELAFYINNARNTTTITCGAAATNDAIAPNAVLSCTLGVADNCGPGVPLRVTVPGGQDIVSCS